MIMHLQEEQVLAMIKGKRSKRPPPASPSSSTTAGGQGSGDPITSNSVELISNEMEEDMANCLILLSKGQESRKPEIYRCKTCTKSFPTFQALGGHRASHKKTFEENLNLKIDFSPLVHDHEEGMINLALQIPSKIYGSHQNKTRVHECLICGAEFASGQALGGHMRRHRPIPAVAGKDNQELAKRSRTMLSLDLNLPAPEDHDHKESSSNFGFAAKDQQVIVFSASSLVDCLTS